MEKKRKILPQHKLKQWVLPDTPRHRKKSGKKHWRIEAKYHGPNNLFKSMHGDRTVGRYATRPRAEKALKRLEHNPRWKHFTFKIVNIRTKRS